MIGITEISAIVAAVGVLIGVVFTVLQLRDLVKTRQTDLIMRLYSRFGSEGFQKTWDKVRRREALSFNDYDKKYGLAEWVAVGTFFEGIGVLLYRKLIDIALVDDLFTAPIKLSWDVMKGNIIEARKEFGQPTTFEWFEYLYGEMQKKERSVYTAPQGNRDATRRSKNARMDELGL
jgi:hypothetical protein